MLTNDVIFPTFKITHAEAKARLTRRYTEACTLYAATARIPLKTYIARNIYQVKMTDGLRDYATE